MRDSPGRPDHPLYQDVVALREQGYTLREVGARLGISHELARRIEGGSTGRRSRTGESLYFPIRREERNRIAKIAQSFGFRNIYGPYVGNGSIVQLLERIASGEIVLTRVPDAFITSNGTPSRVRIKAESRVWNRLDQQAKALGIFVDGPERRRQRRIAMLLRAIAQGAVTLRWRDERGGTS